MSQFSFVFFQKTYIAFKVLEQPKFYTKPNMTIAEFDHLEKEQKKTLLTQCCGSSTWVHKMLAQPAFEDLFDLEETAEKVWWECTTLDWLEAFTHHPKIGDISSLKKKFIDTAAWASNEQSGVNNANETIIANLAKGNEDYENKFGFIFIVCATGKSAEEMLNILQSRLPNTLEEEIQIAADEQMKITKLRLEKLF